MMMYLVDQYGKDSGLLPTDPKQRATVNQRLFFDMGVLYQRFADTYYPVMFGGQPYSAEKGKALDEAYTFLDGYLGKSEWAAGDKYTLADIALVATVSTAEVCMKCITNITMLIPFRMSVVKNISNTINFCVIDSAIKSKTTTGIF